MKIKNWNSIIKIVITFILYLSYTTLFDKMFKICGINTNVLTMFISDLIFLITIILLYRKNIKEDFKIFNKEYPIKKKILIIGLGVLILFLVNMLMGAITQIFIPTISTGNDENTSAIIDLFSASYIYTLFKTLLFAPIAEELLFKEGIRDVVKNNILFVLISSAIYTTMNFIYSSMGTPYMIIDIIGYFLFSAILSVIYLKNDDNIILVMFIKFFYNIIPTVLLLLSVVI